MNPFDLKSVTPAKRAQHAALVHFSIALIVVSVAFDLISLRKRSLALLPAAYYYTVTVAAIPAAQMIVTGTLAWQLQFEGKAPKENLKLHMILALSSSVMVWLVCWLDIMEKCKPQDSSPGVRLTVEIVAVAITMLIAHVGGFVSGVNGPGLSLRRIYPSIVAGLRLKPLRFSNSAHVL